MTTIRMKRREPDRFGLTTIGATGAGGGGADGAGAGCGPGVRAGVNWTVCPVGAEEGPSEALPRTADVLCVTCCRFPNGVPTSDWP